MGAETQNKGGTATEGMSPLLVARGMISISCFNKEYRTAPCRSIFCQRFATSSQHSASQTRAHVIVLAGLPMRCALHAFTPCQQDFTLLSERQLAACLLRLSMQTNAATAQQCRFHKVLGVLFAAV